MGSAPGILFYLIILGQAAKRLYLEVGWWLHFFIIFFQLQSFGKKALWNFCGKWCGTSKVMWMPFPCVVYTQLFWVDNLSRWVLPWGCTCLPSHNHGSTNLRMPWRAIPRPMLPIWSLCSPERICRTQAPRTRHKPFREEWESFIETFSSAKPTLHVLSDQTLPVRDERIRIPQTYKELNNLASQNLLQKSVLAWQLFLKWICRRSKAL